MKKKKQALTLLEIMIVIFLIGIIGSVIGYNMKGSLEEGKAFKTERAMEQVKDVLMLEIAKGEDAAKVQLEPEKYLKVSGIVKNPANLLKDGWGKPLKIDVDAATGEVVVSSEAYANFQTKKIATKG